MFLSSDLDKFKNVQILQLYANYCDFKSELFLNVNRREPLREYCSGVTLQEARTSKRGNNFNIELQDDDDPHVLTKMSYISQRSGKIVFAQSHLHTGAVNATLRINGEIICSTGTKYGNDMNPSTNARNEQNHLVHIDTCLETGIFDDGGINFNIGDVITSESIYFAGINDDRLDDGMGGEHKMAMSWFFMYVYFYND